MSKHQDWSDGDPERGVYVPPCPQIVIRIREVKEDVDAVSGLVESDPGLAGEILKVVNSPLFGLRVKVVDVRKAVGLLGLDWVINIVIGLKLKANLGGDQNAFLDKFWHSSNLVALQARHIMQQLELPWKDEAYLTGLVHDCGIPLMIRTFGAAWEPALKQGYADEGLVTQYESKHFHTSHAKLSFLVAAAWGLPKPLVYCIRDHHEALSGIDLQHEGAYANVCYSHLWCVLKLAEFLCELPVLYFDQGEVYEWQQVAATVLEFLKLDPERIEALKITPEED